MKISHPSKVVGHLGPAAAWWLGAIAILPLPFAAAGPGRRTGMDRDLRENPYSFQDPKDHWSVCGGVKLDPANRRKLAAESGHGLPVSNGHGVDLRTKETYRDCEVEVEFMIPQGSNSGVKLAGCYEVQIFDSWKKKKVTGSDCGGIYPRAEMRPRYHTIDDGVPPKTNACREPGQWQTLKISVPQPPIRRDRQ